MRTDFLLDDNYDLDIDLAAGDFSIGGSAQQEVDLLLQSNKGEWRESPTVGVGIMRYLKKVAGNTARVDNVNRFVREVKVGLQADGFDSPDVIVTPDLSDFKINVEP